MELEKIKEVILVGGVLAVAMTSSSHAASTTSIGAAPSAQIAIAVTAGAAGGYVITEFNLSLSANTSMQYLGDATGVAINVANSRGMHHFGGSTNGGSFSACETTSVSTPSAATPSSPSNGC